MDSGWKKRAEKFWREYARPFLFVVIVLTAFRSSVADWNDVPTGSMRPTIIEGDRIFVNKLAYDLKVPFTTWHIAQWDNPHRGDIVVFFSPYDGQRLVKRVIGLPGDIIELRDNSLVINGEPVKYQPIEQELLRDLSQTERSKGLFASEQLPGLSHVVAAKPNVRSLRSFAPYTVPQGHYFVMGDNRDDSFDSRYWGAVARDRIVGRATTVVLSFDRQHFWQPRWHRFLSSLSE